MSRIIVQPDDQAIRRLRSLASGNPGLADVARIYEAVLPLLRDAGGIAGRVTLTAGEAAEKIETGQYLLSGMEPRIDTGGFMELLTRLAGAVESAASENLSRKSGAARDIRLALEESRVNTADIITVLDTGHNGVFIAAECPDLDHELFSALLRNAARPLFSTWRSSLSESAGEVYWQNGYCYVCGATAAMAELQGSGQEMHLRCTTCGGDWKFSRLKCMYCGNDDHNTQGYFCPEGESEIAMVELCDRCMGYVKVFNSFEPTSPELLIVMDLETLPLDFIARDRGYTRHLLKV